MICGFDAAAGNGFGLSFGRDEAGAGTERERNAVVDRSEAVDGEDGRMRRFLR